jgi:hypothetical protein
MAFEAAQLFVEPAVSVHGVARQGDGLIQALRDGSGQPGSWWVVRRAAGRFKAVGRTDRVGDGISA